MCIRDRITSKVKSNIDEIVYILGDESYFNTEVVNSLKIISEKYKAKTKIYRQLEQLGTGHAIMCAEESLSGPSIIAYADTMIQGNIEIDTQVDGIMWVKKVDNHSPYAVENIDSEWIIWLDADTEAIENIDINYLSKFMPFGYVSSYLGRPGRYTETGWLAWNMNHPDSMRNRTLNIDVLDESVHV